MFGTADAHEAGSFVSIFTCFLTHYSVASFSLLTFQTTSLYLIAGLIPASPPPLPERTGPESFTCNFWENRVWASSHNVETHIRDNDGGGLAREEIK